MGWKHDNMLIVYIVILYLLVTLYKLVINWSETWYCADCCHLILPIRFVIWSAPVLGHKAWKYLKKFIFDAKHFFLTQNIFKKILHFSSYQSDLNFDLFEFSDTKTQKNHSLDTAAPNFVDEASFTNIGKYLQISSGNNKMIFKTLQPVR